MRNTFTVAAIAALIALAPAAAQAATECQAAQTGGAGTDAASAWENWQDNVASAYGAAWAKLNLAQNKSVVPISLPSLGGGTITTYSALAVPCRTVRLTAGLTANVGDFGVMQTEPAPTVQGTFKKLKLATSFQ